MRNEDSFAPYYATMPSPLGELTIVADGNSITHIALHGEKEAVQVEKAWHKNARIAPIAAALRQLREYFRARRTSFDLPLSVVGTAFERRVWAELLRIPYGETCTYGGIARKIGKPNAARAVGLACGKNPIAIVVPCHRVIGAGGALTGYAGGIERKIFLLQFEGVRLKRSHAAIDDNNLPRDIRRAV